MNIRKMIVMTMFVAIAVVGSIFVSFPAGIARAYPIQHAVNVIAAVTLGPIPAVVIAFLTALIRILTGTGSLLAFPGGMIGACLAGLLFKQFGKIWLAGMGELIGTGLFASLFAVPYAKILMGTSTTALFFLPSFFVSSASGMLIGIILATRLQKTGVLKKMNHLSL
ncbi:energy coupling factor transporter S component ThiW [Lederbergia sp. NSJ-179]|uniref:energy coupling factor transporter S component ThiW n=1 Tax=Lederbergia sp. NSJ-179 TaxID=2931402 RepID=UPI001FCF7F73|nr:energy coupling factor transporter S component ThiW [Lederbergia sp. NSJ-179]MCJ7841006.1 energy coupling factor transporter S component ThiW [Lederbergia sp. NSJ-179]